MLQWAALLQWRDASWLACQEGDAGLTSAGVCSELHTEGRTGRYQTPPVQTHILLV